MKKYIPLAIAVACILAPLFFANGCANTTQAPSGGPKDTIPPMMLWANPGPGTTGVPVHGTKLQFGFNEYVKVKTPANIFLSPPQAKIPKTKIKQRSVIVSFEEDLEPGTTYTLSFTDAIADNNEGNMFQGYNYVFSTGETIDSMIITGKVQDCSTLSPVKGATVLLYRDLADSAIFLHRPFAATKTDDWGFFAIPFIQDTLYRLYALKDDNNDNLYNPENKEKVAFIDSVIRPVRKVVDTLPEMMRFDMKDTLGCQSRYEEYVLSLFTENPSKQMLVNKERVGDRTAYITFMAHNAWIDSLWIAGYPADHIITQFNIQQDSLEIWVNDRRPAPDTLHLYVNYRKTDTLGLFQSEVEHIKLISPTAGINKNSRAWRSKLKHEDTTCVYTLTVKPETVEQNGFELEFKYPVINAQFDSLHFRYLNPKQKEFTGELNIERDSLNLRRYILRPKVQLQTGFEYFLKIPQGIFRDINGFRSDSTEVKVSLPTDETLSCLTAEMRGVDRKIIVDLLNEKRNEVLRQYIIDSDADLRFPYLKAGKYSLRVTDDGNRNGMVDTGCLLEHRQPEQVCFYKLNDKDYIDIQTGFDVTQTIDIQVLFGLRTAETPAPAADPSPAVTPSLADAPALAEKGGSDEE